jgi:hypothetical protein
MDAYNVQKWERVKELARECAVSVQVRDMIELYDWEGRALGHHATVGEAYAFLCGYEHYYTVYKALPLERCK